jgi:hypothetical protein
LLPLREIEMQLSDTQTKVMVGVLVLVVIGVVYMLWTRSVPPEPVIGPGQSLKNPLGEAPQSRRTQAEPPGAGAPGAPANTPAPGTFDPQRGFGPSRGAPIPGSR